MTATPYIMIGSMNIHLIRISSKLIRFTAYIVMGFSILFVADIPDCLAKVPARQAMYVGSLACKPCHTDEYENFLANAKKSKSFQSIERLKKGLSEEDLKKCYACHTTGYGKPGGFISAEKTPDLKNAGCEVCHGPGSIHIQTKDPAYIKKNMTMQDCEACHTSERVKAFRFKPLIHGGGH